MTRMKQPATEKERIYWLDNLRTFMIFLVVVLHAGLVYESSGIAAFFWIVDDPSTNDLSGILNLMLDIFVMPTIFFISGFLALPSLRSKSGFAFLRSKFKRLMIPWAIAVLTLIPLYKVIFLYSRNLPQQDWTTYFHWSNGIWGMNWLWFLPVLFLFNALFQTFSRIDIKLDWMTLRSGIWALIFIGFVYSICMDIFSLQGWTKTLLVDFQNERLLIYFLAFLSGSLCYKLKTFEAKPKSRRFFLLLACTVWIPVNLYLFLVIYSLINPGLHVVSEIVDLLLIRATFIVSLICLLYLVINTFRIFVDRKGRIGTELNASSYQIYIVHTIVLGGVALVLFDTAIPSIWKHLILAVSTFVVSGVIVSLCRGVKGSLLNRGQGRISGRMTHREA